MKNNKIIILYVVLFVFSITGCWDRMSIDQRAFVVAMGIDKFVFDEAKDEPSLDTYWSQYRITFVTPNLPKLVGQQGVSEEPKFVKVSVGPTISNTYKALESRINKTIYFGHTKSILLGQELLKDKVLLKQAMDTLQRNSAFSRSIPVVAVEGSVEEVLMVTPDIQPVIGIYIMQLFENNRDEGGFFEEKKLGDLLQNFQEDKMALIPKLTVGEKDLKIAGAAVIKDYELLGWLDERQIRGLLWIIKKNHRLEMSAPYNDFHIAYNVSESDTQIKFNQGNKDEETISCKVIVETEGSIDEYILDEYIFNNKEIKNVEKAIEKAIEEEILYSIGILQERYKVDVIQIGKELERQKPEEWRKVKDNWEEVFEDISFTVDVHTNIRRVGQTK